MTKVPIHITVEKEVKDFLKRNKRNVSRYLEKLVLKDISSNEKLEKNPIWVRIPVSPKTLKKFLIKPVKGGIHFVQPFELSFFVFIFPSNYTPKLRDREKY